MTRRPLAIYVSGAPGSGKTTLARSLSEKFFIPHISSDLVHGGVRFTQGRPNDREKSLHEAFVPLMLHYAENDVSFVVDQVLQKDKSKIDIIDKLSPLANIIFIHTIAEQPIERHLNRELSRTDRGLVYDEEFLKNRAKFHNDNLAQTNDPAEWERPVLVVRTDNGYEPDLEKICDFIEAEYHKKEAE